MSKVILRKDKTCQNCRHVVENRFCPNCGQENTETRQSFKHLAAHFMEDFTHYDNAFWSTIKYLLLYPAKLTKEYLSGKRQQFVPPVKLYIFISFVAFLIPSLIGKEEESKPKIYTEDASDRKELFSILGAEKYKNVQQLDSVQATLPESEKLGTFHYWFKKNVIDLNDKHTKEEIKEKFGEAFYHNLPKAIFLYLPIFGFWLWVFHGKKRWIFFDHGIFTLHYIAFILLTITISFLIEEIIALIPDGSLNSTLSGLNYWVTYLWIFIYFYMSHKRMYQENSWVSNTKSTFLIIINSIFIVLLLSLFSIYTLFHLK